MTFLQGVILVVALAILTTLYYSMSGGWKNALVMGTVTGLIMGRPDVGLTVGASCLLMEIGFYPYGGAITPNYSIGAVFGVIVAINTSDSDQGILVGSVVALIASWFIIIKGFVNVQLIHLEEKAIKDRNLKKVEFFHIMGMVSTYVLTTAAPIVIGLLVIDQYTVLLDFVNQYAWLKQGLQVISHLLPAVGFALLLTYMDIKKYWPFMIIGYVAYAYFGVPTMAIALLGIAIAYLYAFVIEKQKGEQE